MRGCGSRGRCDAAAGGYGNAVPGGLLPRVGIVWMNQCGGCGGGSAGSHRGGALTGWADICCGRVSGGAGAGGLREGGCWQNKCDRDSRDVDLCYFHLTGLRNLSRGRTYEV